MSASAAPTWFDVAAILLILAGGGHALVALIDTVRPRWFAPNDDAVRSAMERTGMRFRDPFPGDGERPSLWTFWLGFNVSHGLGVFSFGLVCLLISASDYDLIAQVDGLRLLTVAIPAVYFAVALRYWFNAVMLLAGSATACFAVAALLSA